MPQHKLEDELRAVWAEWSAPPDYGLWHEHKVPTAIEATEEAIGLKAKDEPAPEPADLTPAHSSASVGGGAAAAAKGEEEDDWGDKPSDEVRRAREQSANGPGGYVRRGRTLERTPSKSRPQRSVSFSDKHAADQFREITALINKATKESAAARSVKLAATREEKAAKKAAKEVLKLKLNPTPNVLEVKKRKKRAPKTTESVAT